MARMTIAELRRLCVQNPDFAARNASALKALSATPGSADVAELNPGLGSARNAALDGAETLVGYLRMLAPDLAPLFFREYPFHTWRIDLAIPDRKLAIEVNGGRWLPGGGKHGTERDREKIRRLTLAGWRVLEYSTQLLDDNPLLIIEQIREALG